MLCPTELGYMRITGQCFIHLKTVEFLRGTNECPLTRSRFSLVFLRCRSDAMLLTIPTLHCMLHIRLSQYFTLLYLLQNSVKFLLKSISLLITKSSSQHFTLFPIDLYPKNERALRVNRQSRKHFLFSPVKYYLSRLLSLNFLSVLLSVSLGFT